MEQQAPKNPVDIMRLNSVVDKEEIGRSEDGQPITRPIFDSIDFPVQQESDIAGMGQPMSLPFLISQINEYKQQYIEIYEALGTMLTKLQEEINVIEEQLEGSVSTQRIDNFREMLHVTRVARSLVGSKEIAIDLGKESLMLLMSQKDCEGIRFYFCNSPYGSNSVAAVGIKAILGSDGLPRKIPHPHDSKRDITEAQDIGIKDGYQSILQPEATIGITQVLNEEVGPPYRIRQYSNNNERTESRREDLENGFIESLREANKKM